MTFIQLATVRAKPGRAEEVKADLLNIVENVKKNEPGTLLYHLSVDVNDDHLFEVWEEYADQEAYVFHGTTDIAKVFKSRRPEYVEIFHLRRRTPLAKAA